MADLAIFFFRRCSFEKQITLNELIEKFIDKYNLEKVKNDWFIDQQESISLTFVQSEVEEEQKRFYQRLNITIGHKAIKFNGTSVAKSATEFSSGAQIQPLYSSQETNICFFFTNKNLGDYYNFQTSNTSEYNLLNTMAFNGTPVILYGPPGTGKTYKMQNDYINNFPKDNCFVTTFHQSFSYEEFVEGLKPFIPIGSQDVNYKVEPGLFYNACERAAVLAGYTTLDECLSDSFESRKEKMKSAIDGKNVVLLCIDEINRANVSSVFGDLISLVESSKRLGAEYEMTAKLPYSKKDFGVPANLMIIGTMNTADRSIQLLDSALRRRFKFEELLPQYDAIKNDTAKKILKNINNRIRALLDKDHQIGHSYFIGVDSNLKILKVMKENIIPLLEEYFYNETDKIRRVLNESEELRDENSHSDDYFYVLDMDAKNAVKDTDDFNEEKPYYKLNDKLKSIKDEESATTILAHLE